MHIEAPITKVDDDSACRSSCTQQQQRQQQQSNTIDDDDGRSTTTTTRCRSGATTRLKASKYRQANQHRLDHTYAVALSNYRSKARRLQADLVISEDDKIENGNNDAVATIENDKNDAVATIEMEETVDVETCEERRCSDSSWLKNSRRDYKPTAAAIRKGSGRRRRRQNSDGKADKENLSFYFTRSSGVVKQYRGNRRLTRLGANKSISKIVRPAVQEDKRWIAALALIELAQQSS